MSGRHDGDVPEEITQAADQTFLPNVSEFDKNKAPVKQQQENPNPFNTNIEPNDLQRDYYISYKSEEVYRSLPNTLKKPKSTGPPQDIEKCH